MLRHLLSDILSEVSILDSDGPPEIEVTGLSYDSRTTQPGQVFFAIHGFHVDGHDYITRAIDKGAVAVVYSDNCPGTPSQVATIRVADSRLALSMAASAWYGHPSSRIPCIGITGTDGKSTTVHFLWQILRKAGFKTGCVSTVYLSTGTETEKNPFRQSTPEAPEIQSILSQMVENGCTFAVVEATSHGLSTKTHRLSGVRWLGAVFTNLGHEHLEFHGSFEQYREDKCRLFGGLTAGNDSAAFGIVNADDENAVFFRSATSHPVTGISLAGKDSDVRITDIEETTTETSFTLTYRGASLQTSIRIPGRYNVFNTAAALMAAHFASGISLPELAQLTPELRAPQGRMDEIVAGQPFRVIVDFAHTPGSFETVLPMLKSSTEGRLIVVFGSAGERDTEKRAMQGNTASRYADVIYLADEDPRGEEPEAILREIASGCKAHTEGSDLHLISDRRHAFRQAMKQARKGDTVALLGKGHESSIIYASGPVPWDEGAVARSILAEMGYRNE
ncbi:MAG: UDP-N-acetylmuramoyl-L-alanyl-D-glutamate--2,6-diaminopimelate ligase [Spirochaetaceae bacterium]|nr:MAG: UDP-N-acetylmuramoyl-L-alanyl-D-glutamate--2,6-diaminopimelate ligase [Spirochaetaceae bacterium]